MMRLVRKSDGFTMIELLVAMAVFSFMLLIIVVGFINIVRLHNQALASNTSQDNARTAMDELVRAVRDSAGVVTPAPGVPANTLCLANASGPQRVYYLNGGILYRADDCTSRVNAVAVTSTAVQVANFVATVKTAGASILKPQVELTVTIATTGNGTTTGSGASIACGPSTADRTFCSVVTLTSGAVPR
jgi:prepilin-type N-terminal cleavage/methylation domain-containing protein